MVYTIDTTKIEERGWSWTVTRLGDLNRFVSYVQWKDMTQTPALGGVQAWGDNPQEALSNAYAKAEATLEEQYLGVKS